MEGQCGQRAGRHHQQVFLVLHQRVDGLEQNFVELMRSAEVKQVHDLACDRIVRAVDIETAPERGHFLRQRLVANGDWRPLEALARQRKDFRLLLAVENEDQRLVEAEQRLQFLDLERSRLGQGRVIGELLFQLSRSCGDGAVDLADLPAEFFDRSAVLLPFRLRQRRDQTILGGATCRRPILQIAHHRGERAPARGEARAQLLQRSRCFGLPRPLRDFESLATERVFRLDLRARGGGEIGDMAPEIIGAPFDQPARFAGRRIVADVDPRMGQNGGGRAPRIGQRIGGVAIGTGKRGKVVERQRHVGMGRAASTFADQQRPAEQLLRIAKPSLALIDGREIVEDQCDLGMAFAERLFLYRKRPLMEGAGIGVFSLVLIDDRKIVERRRDIRMVRSERLFHRRKRTAIERFGLFVFSQTSRTPPRDC